MLLDARGWAKCQGISRMAETSHTSTGRGTCSGPTSEASGQAAESKSGVNPGPAREGEPRTAPQDRQHESSQAQQEGMTQRGRVEPSRQWGLRVPCSRPQHFSRYPGSHHSPETNGQQVGQQQGREEDLEELSREDAPLLHDARVPHAEGRGALGVLEQELPGKEEAGQGLPGPRHRHPVWPGLTLEGCSPAGWTSPRSSPSSSSGYSPPLSSAPESPPRTGEVGVRAQVSHTQPRASLSPFKTKGQMASRRVALTLS